MLGWVVTCHDNRAQEILDALEREHGALLQCRTMNSWRELSPGILGHMICDTLYETDSGEGAILLTDIAGAPPHRVASLLSHRHSRYEMISGVMLPLIGQTMVCRETIISSTSREHIVELGTPEMGSPRHQQQKNPPFVLKHNLYEYQPAILVMLLL